MTAVTPGRLQQGHRSDSLKSSGTVESGGSGNAGLHTTAPQDGASLDDLVPAALIGARDGLPGLVTWFLLASRKLLVYVRLGQGLKIFLGMVSLKVSDFFVENF